MNTSQGSLTIINAHTTTPQVFWNGVVLDGIKDIHVENNKGKSKVVISIRGIQTDTYTDMKSSGIVIKRLQV